ncbi:hypothetical protein [Photorhabdus hindustanensis]|uniref:Uncharacterized protein n=1 Tax=Photorhabdus hindustanensis TaxID=2918802 RepID=A0A2S8Q1I3_9GAMM|nr:hypothetical protein [Photorhabdus hindustanensis]PQQ25697.1 hypothetical protein C6H66_11480 [Photorhabdus hindustanensis]
MTFFQRINKIKYEIIAVLLMVSIGLLNFGWLSLKTISETPPGYYENIVIEHMQLLTNLRNEYHNQRDEMRNEMLTKKHTFLETVQIALKLNVSESRYLDFWLAEKPIIIGMLKPFEESKYLSWYVHLPQETRNLVKNIADNLHEVYPKLAKCNQNAAKDYMALVSGLTAPSDDKISDALVAQTQVIMRNISQSQQSSSEICDNAMVSYFSSVQLLSRTYSTLADTYQDFSKMNETIRKIISTILSFCLFLVCYRCRENLIKKAAQSMGG